MERSKPLHNFPVNLKWGFRMILKSGNVSSNGEFAPATAGDWNTAVERRLIDRVMVSSSEIISDRVETGRSVERLWIGDEGITAFRKEIISDLHSKADKMKDDLREGFDIEKEKEETSPLSRKKSPSPQMNSGGGNGGATNPCNLRTRRAACKAPMNSGGGNGEGGMSLIVDVSRKPNNLSSLRNHSKSPESKGHAAGDAPSGRKRERVKFSCTLSRSEIEQDFLAMTGQRLPRRPKKRPRAVQKILENLSPAMWLREVHPDLYKVPDVPENGMVN